jgi:hypothetical protein
VRLSRCEVRDHISYRKNDRWCSYQFYRASQRLKLPMRYICEIFGAPRFPSFSTQSHAKQTWRCSLPSPKTPRGGTCTQHQKTRDGCVPKYSASSCKSLQPQFRGKMRKFPRHFKGHFSIGNIQVRVLSGQPGSHSTQDSTVEKCRKCPPNAAFCKFVLCLYTPKFNNL